MQTCAQAHPTDTMHMQLCIHEVHTLPDMRDTETTREAFEVYHQLTPFRTIAIVQADWQSLCKGPGSGAQLTAMSIDIEQ